MPLQINQRSPYAGGSVYIYETVYEKACSQIRLIGFATRPEDVLCRKEWYEEPLRSRRWR